MLFTRQPFLIPKSLYTRLPCIKYKSAIHTAAVSRAKCFYTRLPFIQYKNVIYTAAVFHEKRFIYIAAEISRDLLISCFALYDAKRKSASVWKFSFNSSAWGATYSALVVIRSTTNSI